MGIFEKIIILVSLLCIIISALIYLIFFLVRKGSINISSKTLDKLEGIFNIVFEQALVFVIFGIIALFFILFLCIGSEY